MEQEFIESSESNKSLEALIGVNLKILSLTCIFLALWLHPGLLQKRWQVQTLLSLNSLKLKCVFYRTGKVVR